MNAWTIIQPVVLMAHAIMLLGTINASVTPATLAQTPATRLHTAEVSVIFSLLSVLVDRCSYTIWKKKQNMMQELFSSSEVWKNRKRKKSFAFPDFSSLLLTFSFHQPEHRAVIRNCRSARSLLPSRCYQLIMK